MKKIYERVKSIIMKIRNAIAYCHGYIDGYMDSIIERYFDK